MKQANKFVLLIYSLLALFALIIAGSQFGGLRFVSPRADFLVGIAALWLPALCVLLLGFAPRSKARIWSFVLLIPLAVLCLLIVLASTALEGLVRPDLLSTDVDPSFARQASVRLGNSMIVTYFSDAGAWDSGEVVVQQEINILPGLIWVRPLSRKSCLRDVSITVLSKHYVQCYYPADKADSCDPSPEEKRETFWVF